MHQKYVRKDVDFTFCQSLLSSLLTGNPHRFPNSHTFRPSENPVFGNILIGAICSALGGRQKISPNSDPSGNEAEYKQLAIL